MEIIQQRAEIAHLKLWIAKLRRHRFGRRSERAGTRLDPLELQWEELETGAAEMNAHVEPGPARSAAPPRFRAPSQPTCRATFQLHQPDAFALTAAGRLKPLGEDVAERLEYVPSHFRVIRHRFGPSTPAAAATGSSRRRHRRDRSPRIGRSRSSGPCAGLEIFRSPAALSAIRDLRAFRGRSVPFDPGRWVGEAAALLRPLVEAVRRHVLARTNFTPTTRRCRCSRPARARRNLDACGPMSATVARAATRLRQRSGSPIPQTGKAGIPEVTCASFAARCTPTATPASNGLPGGQVYEVGCWAHVRRKFYDLHHAHASPLAADALRASARSTPSKPSCEASRPRFGRKAGKPAPARNWRRSGRGCKPPCPRSRKSRPWPRRSATP